MINIFLKKSKITSYEWKIAYQRIGSITQNFPIELTRVESYKGFESNLDKLHLDLVANSGSEDEHIAINGDTMSYTSGTQVKYYKS